MYQVFNILSFLLMLLVTFYGKRLLALNMISSEFAPWGISCSNNLLYLKILAKLLAPFMLGID